MKMQSHFGTSANKSIEEITQQNKFYPNCISQIELAIYHLITEQQ